jgi:glycosyltransferase involved in cell wall biosynthesis
MSQVHVLFFAEDFPASSQVMGGVRVSVRRQADLLATRHRVTVVALHHLVPPLRRYAHARAAAAPAPAASAAAGDASNGEAGGSLRVLHYRYLHVPFLWPLTSPLQVCLIGLWAWLRHARGAELIHGHRAYVPGLVAVLLGRLLGRPSLVTVYGSEIHQHARGRNRPLAFWIRRVLQLASCLIAVSESLMSALAELGVEAARRRYVPSGVDVTRFAPAEDPAVLRAALALPGERRVLLAPNLFVPIKGHTHLVEAFRLLCEQRDDCNLVMTSEGPLRARIEAQVRDAGLADRVRFTGFLDYDEVPRWFAAADLLVLPSLNEGMPLTILESFACGKPVVATRVGGTPELVTDERYGLLVEPADATALAAALDSALERSWSAAALEERAAEFAWPRVVERIEAIYGELASPRP